MKKILLITLVPMLLHPCQGQETPIFEDLMQRLAEYDEETGQELAHEMFAELLRQPLNLNTCSESDLNASGLFSPFQVYGILKYRQTYGPFFSIYELMVIPGFSTNLLRNIASLITLSAGPANTVHPAPRGMLLTNMAVRLPASAAYLADSSGLPAYPGSPFKYIGRLKVDAGDRWSAAAAFEKDPGERYMNKSRPEHFTSNVVYKGNRWLRKLIMGNYRIHRGMGLVHGLGFQTTGDGIFSGGYRRSYAKAFASTMEYDYYRGGYAELATGRWSADLFFSVKPEDISLFRLKGPADLFDQVRKTGLHRTESERNGTGLARQQVVGFSLNRSTNSWYLGMAVTGTSMKLTAHGRDSVERIAPGIFKTLPRGAISIYGVAFGNKYELFGEAAMDQHTGWAMIAGGTFEVNPALQPYFSFRCYQPGYSGLTPNAYCAATRPENETALNLGVNIVPFDHARLLLNSDFSHKKNLPGKPAEPGFYILNHMKISYVINEEAEFDIRLTVRSKYDYLASGEPGNDKYLPEQQYRLRINGRYNLSEYVILSSRLEHSMLNSGGVIHNGKILYSQITIKPSKKVRCTYRYLVFDSEYWENRIYAYEPGVRYSFLFPAWYGSGKRNLLVLSAKLNRWFTVRSKLGITAYDHCRETGSGDDIRIGNRVLDGEIQIQLDF